MVGEEGGRAGWWVIDGRVSGWGARRLLGVPDTGCSWAGSTLV